MTDSDAIRSWLLEKLGKGQELPDNACGQSYFDLGLVDSFGIIELIEDVESEFSIQFTEDHFQERRFATIDGLTQIILEIKNGTENRLHER